MKLEFEVFRQEHVDGVLDCIYQTWKDNPWIKAFTSEKEAKQAFWDRINHYGVFEKSIVCIDREKDEIVGCVLAQDALQYLGNQHKWSFHKQFEVIEEFISICAFRIFNHCQPENSIWGFWMSSKISQQKIPWALFCLLQQLNYPNQYQYLIGFTNHLKTADVTKKFNATYLDPVQLKDLKKAKFDKDITLYPQFGDFKAVNSQVESIIKKFNIKLVSPKPSL